MITARGRCDIAIANFQAHEEVRYPVIFLEGTVPGDTLSITGGIEQCPTVQQGRFKALVELRQGENTVRLTSGTRSAEITLRYRPSTTDYLVQPVLLTSSDEPFRYPGTHGPTNARAEKKLSTAMKLYQCFTSEEMNRHGFGRKTFHMPIDKDNNVRVLSMKTKHITAKLEPLSDKQAHRVIAKCLPRNRKVKYVVVSKFASGQGSGRLAVSMSKNMAYWANSTADVIPALTNPTRNGLPFGGWKISMIGPSIHEIGHLFYLPHPGSFRLAGDWPRCDSNRHYYIMEGWHRSLPSFFTFSDNKQAVRPRWGDQTRFLRFSKWFAPDPPRITVPPAKPTIEIRNDTVTATSPAGLGAVIWIFKQRNRKRAVTDRSVEGKTQYSISIAKLKTKYRAPRATALSVHVIDQEGNTAGIANKVVDA